MSVWHGIQKYIARLLRYAVQVTRAEEREWEGERERQWEGGREKYRGREREVQRRRKERGKGRELMEKKMAKFNKWDGKHKQLNFIFIIFPSCSYTVIELASSQCNLQKSTPTSVLMQLQNSRMNKRFSVAGIQMRVTKEHIFRGSFFSHDV